MSELSSLKTAIASSRSEQEIQNALASYLKKTVPNSSSELLKGVTTLNKQCGPGVDAEECKAIIDQCISGDVSNQARCKQVLSDLVTNPSRQKALADGIKGMDGRMARQVCKTLSIDYELPNAVDTWVKNLLVTDATAARAIKDNAPLMDIITSFVVAAANPLLNPKSLGFSKMKAAMSVLPIPTRTPRTYEHKSDAFTGGGNKVNLIANTYEQYTDSLKRLASMSGGGAELNKTHDEIANIYNSFVYSLRANGKEIDSNDNLKIRHELDKLRAIEEKLSKVVIYITRYNALLNSSDKEVQQLIAKGTIDVNLLEQLNVKYEELKKRHEKKSYGIISITDAINKVLSAADSVRADVASMKECLGPLCEESKRARESAVAPGAPRGVYNSGSGRFGVAEPGLRLGERTPSGTPPAGAPFRVASAANPFGDL